MENARICKLSLDKRHNFINGQCLNGCQTQQEVLGQKERVKEEVDMGDYLEQRLKAYMDKMANPDKTKARDYGEEIAWKYIKEFNWTNDTLEKDYKSFWIACKIAFKVKTTKEYEDILKWGAEKHVYPRAIVGVLLRKKTLPKWANKYK